MRSSIVLTTIHNNNVLEPYFQNLSKFGHLEDTEVIVIPDKNTPVGMLESVEIYRKKGLSILCPTLEEQESFLNKINFPSHLIPYHSDNRRNIGFLMATSNGCDVLISIDDDNHAVLDDSFIDEHMSVCRGPEEAQVVNSESKWFNIMEMLDTNQKLTIYPRGFPYYARHQKVELEFTKENVDVVLNSGLWLGDPDIDAMSWLVAPTKVNSFSQESLVLAPSVWSPINTQNTALRREVVPSYYYIKMKYPIKGTPLGRYGDILSGYFCQACVKHLGHSVRIGGPLVIHNRNHHNFINDAVQEMSGLLVLEELLNWLTNEAKLEGVSYSESYLSLSYQIQDAVEHFKGTIWDDSTRGFFHSVAYHMRIWLQATKTIL